MKHTCGKWISTILFVIGCFPIFLALIYTEWSTGLRLTCGGVGLGLCLIAKVALVRCLLASLMGLVVCISSIVAGIHDPGRIDLLWFCILTGSAAIAAYYGWKVFSKIKYPISVPANTLKDIRKRCSDTVPDDPATQSPSIEFRPAPIAKPHTVQDTIDDTVCVTSLEDLSAWEESHPLLDEIRTKVVGISYDNDDGSSRQEIVSKCRPGECVIFHPFKYCGEPALAVYTEHGQIGHLSADLARELEEYEEDLILSGTITEITGGSGGLYYGCNLCIKVYKN